MAGRRRIPQIVAAPSARGGCAEIIDQPISGMTIINAYSRPCAAWAAARSQRDIPAGMGGGRWVSRHMTRNTVSASTVIPQEKWNGTATAFSGGAKPSMTKPMPMFNKISAAIAQCSNIATVV